MVSYSANSESEPVSSENRWPIITPIKKRWHDYFCIALESDIYDLRVEMALFPRMTWIGCLYLVYLSGKRIKHAVWSCRFCSSVRLLRAICALTHWLFKFVSRSSSTSFLFNEICTYVDQLKTIKCGESNGIISISEHLHWSVLYLSKWVSTINNYVNICEKKYENRPSKVEV